MASALSAATEAWRELGAEGEEEGTGLLLERAGVNLC